jgi:hypothetical protein
MGEEQAQSQEALVKEYLKAVEDRELEKCVSYFLPEATIHFMEGIYQGIESVRQWHTDRFDANMRIDEIEDIRIQGDTVTVDVVIRSDPLRAWRIESLSGYAEATILNGKIQELRFGLNVTNPLEDWS